MKLLFDQNLPHRVVPALAQLFPNSNHVRNVGLGRAWWCLIVGGLGIVIWAPIVVIAIVNNIGR